ncbi:3-hydroxyacyl-CoA dehydrogenase [Alphaproteobacteria bacterium]|nr:3-hydroxyacyl-CoA dehydrogenase [Alphaproteobacteria bacterium]
MKNSIKEVAIVGAGLVGSGWAIVFSRAAINVKIFDKEKKLRNTVLDTIKSQLIQLHSKGLINNIDKTLERISIHDDLNEAIKDADYIQESVFELKEAKIEISRAISQSLNDKAIVGSSTSGIPASEFTENIKNKEKFLVVHPVNPPYLAQIVEIVPSPWTSDETVDLAIDIMNKIGQSPIHIRKELEGFVLNRLQGVLLREAWALYEEGYASLEDIDKTVSKGLGLRWSFMGPFETIDLNAPGGIKDYAERLGDLYFTIQSSRKNSTKWSPELIDKVEAERRLSLSKDKLAERRNWRDLSLMDLMAHKKKIEG